MWSEVCPVRRCDGSCVLAPYLSDIDGESVAQKRVSDSAGADREDPTEPVVSLRTAEGEVERPIRNVTAAQVMARHSGRRHEVTCSSR